MTDIIHPTMTIAGAAATADAAIDVVDPATEQVIGRVPDCSRTQLDDAVAAARAAFPGWRDTPYAERQAARGRIAGAIMEDAEELHRLLTTEQGRPHAAFAGRKRSGLGVENRLDGLLEFTVPQTIHTARAA